MSVDHTLTDDTNQDPIPMAKEQRSTKEKRKPKKAPAPKKPAGGK